MTCHGVGPLGYGQVMSTATVVSLVIGGEGAIVATTLAVQQLRHYRRTVRVECREGVASSADGSTRFIIRVRAINEGRRPVEVRHVCFRTADGRLITPPPVAGGREIPTLLGDGQSATQQFEKDTLERAERDSGVSLAFAVVSDASGNEYLAAYPAASGGSGR